MYNNSLDSITSLGLPCLSPEDGTALLPCYRPDMPEHRYSRSNWNHTHPHHTRHSLHIHLNHSGRHPFRSHNHCDREVRFSEGESLLIHTRHSFVGVDY